MFSCLKIRNSSRRKPEVKLEENLGGGEGVWLNLRLNLRKIRGGGRGSRPIFPDRKKSKLEVLTDGP